MTYNGSKWFEKCFTSLCDSSIPVKVIAIDNASSDETVTLIKQKFPSVDVIQTGSNLGFGQANNIGLKKALKENADYVFLLNQDAWIEPASIAKLVEVHQSNEAFGIISPMHISGDNKSLEYKFKEYIQPPFSDGMMSDLFMNTVKPVYETTFVNAAAWLISKDCLQTVGGFDPLFPHYGEDVDYVQRAQYFNFKVGICPSAKIWHDSRMLQWSEIQLDKKRMMTIYMSEVKSINGSLRSNTLVFIKRRFDELTSKLLFRKFKKFGHHLDLSWQTIRKLSKISKARQASKVKGAFLS